MDRLRKLFEAVANGGRSSTTASQIAEKIAESGIDSGDFRLSKTFGKLNQLGDAAISFEAFVDIVSEELLMVNRALNKQLIIPDWKDFCADIKSIFDQVSNNKNGENADYIPILKMADSEKWGLAICTVDGQRMGLGDVDIYHSIQSVSKPLTYAYALAKEGVAFTHQFVGVEPSGRPFNALDLLPDKRPFNPCVNAGAILTAGLVVSSMPEDDARTITGLIMELWSGLCGAIAPVRFSEETMLSERETADNNYAIAYRLKAQKGLPRGVDLYKMMDIYLSCCSIEMTAKMLSVAAATLTNGGVCPITGEQILSTEIVKKTLAIMQTTGMYDNAGGFTLEVGLPAKSGVAGAVMVVVPNLMGFATFSPRLDSYGNSVRGVAFCRELVDRYTFHIYDNLSGGRTGCKRDPRESQSNRKKRDLSDLQWGAQNGDLYANKVKELSVDCMISICIADGEIEDAEIQSITDAYAEIMGQPADHSLITRLESLGRGKREQSQAANSTVFDQLVGRLETERLYLDDMGREIILESAFRVACSDGVIEESEQRRLRAIADALQISEGVLELEIAGFQRKVAALSPPS